MNLNEDLELEAWSKRPFSSEAFRAEAFASHRYKTDPHFREAVARKLSVSTIGIEPTVYNETQTYVAGGFGEGKTEAGRTQMEDAKTAQRELAEKLGYLAAKPEFRIPVATPVTDGKEGSTWFSKESNTGVGIKTAIYPAQ